MDAKILVIDIETTPTLAYVWSQWRQDVHNQQIVQPTRMLCFAAGWLDERGVDFSSEGLDGTQHYEMVKYAWELMNQADAVVTYNGNKFDIPHLYREFAEWGLKPPSPFISVDLYTTAKRFRFFSHKLDYVTQQLGRRGKLATGGFSLWIECMAGNEVAWRKMERYNRRDVAVTRQLTKDLLPWIKTFPNMNLFREEGDDRPVCPACGRHTLQRRGFRLTQTGRYPRYQCQSCGKWSSEGKRDAGADLRGVS